MSFSKENGMGSSMSQHVVVKSEAEIPRLNPLRESPHKNTSVYSRNAASVIKPEPVDMDNKSLSNRSGHSQRSFEVKPEPFDRDIVMHDPDTKVVPLPTYKVYTRASEIFYTPEDALATGTKMVGEVKSLVEKLELGSKMRKNVYMKDIENLLKQAAPTTMIAVCGATGAGKSSILNAVLDDNIVPTSGMRACTAVVTEIAYHDKATIDADVSFLSMDEWKAELKVLLDDLVDEDGTVKKSSDLRTDAGIAWSKVHSVYPSVTHDILVGLTAEQIISRDPKIAKLLGTTKHISAPDSKAFAKEIAKYIDSKDTRGDKKKKSKKEKEKDKKAKEKRDKGGGKNENEPIEPALWALIRQVNVRAKCEALATGAILVDLPGTADSNEARNNISKGYLQRCSCIWVLAPITRAVDDKTARDLLGDAFRYQLKNGNYDANSITFIASKCDDISCTEIIDSLGLEGNPELEDIEEKIEQLVDEQKEMKRQKVSAEKRVKGCESELTELRKYAEEYDAHLKALKAGITFKSKLSAKSSKKGAGSKRKSSFGGKKGSPKRKRGGDDSDGESDESESDDESEISDQESSAGSSDSDNDDSDDDSKSENSDGDEDSSKSDADTEEDDGDEETEASLHKKKANNKEQIKEVRIRLSAARKDKKESNDAIDGIKKKLARVQKAKNAFCSLKRSEYSREVLKNDFREGLKALDEAEAESNNPDTFDPSVQIRDYDDIDLPVFTCSARDYVRIKGQVKGDGGATCFTDPNDTGIPSLRDWCHQLTVSSRERAARSFLTQYKSFMTSIKGYVQGIGEVTPKDRAHMRELWESSGSQDTDYSSDDEDPDTYPYGGMYAMPKSKPPKVDNFGELIGVTPVLSKAFDTVVDKSVAELQNCFQDGLEDKCEVGADKAAAAAVETSDTVAGSMHWGTYRATLRRHGTFRTTDINVELVNPFTRHIASSWSQIFESDLFSAFEAAAEAKISKLLKDVEDSVADGLKDRVRFQAEQCRDEAKVALNKTMELVKNIMNEEQKTVSRCLAPHVQNQLAEVYNRAMEERGIGSVKRQKDVFRDGVKSKKDVVFVDGADVLLEGLTRSAVSVGAALKDALNDLAEKIEVNLSVLWEDANESPAQVAARAQMLTMADDMLQQIDLWSRADKLRAIIKSSSQ